LVEDRKRRLKELIKRLHAGEPPQEVKEGFRQFLGGVSPLEIAEIEEELIREGLPREEIRRLCDVHLAVFSEQLEKQKPETSPENPINILTEEHKILSQLLEKLSAKVSKIQQAEKANDVTEEITQLKQIADDLLNAEKHYLREENVLFPILEKHGVTEPPAIMWMEHQEMRDKKKHLHDLIRNYDASNFRDWKEQLSQTAKSLYSVLSSHVFKENNILFPTALRVFTEQDWRDVQTEFDEVGYPYFKPKHLPATAEAVEVKKPEARVTATREGLLPLETGTLLTDEIEAILNALPVDITFVDRDDTVRYFNKSEGRIFVRTKAVIGRKVQLCHPQKSIHIVNRILKAFKEGRKDEAEFWIHMEGRPIHIRYFPVRDKAGRYLGTIEVTQDITDIKKLEGEKKLLDWKD